MIPQVGATLAYSVVRFRLQLLVEGDTAGQFFLKHIEKEDDNLLLHGNDTITGVVNWQNTHDSCK
jgi:hypothetical protein